MSTSHDNVTVSVELIQNGTGYADSPYRAILTLGTGRAAVALTLDDLDRLILEAEAVRRAILDGE